MTIRRKRNGRPRTASDEYYVLDLVADVLGEPCEHGKQFPTLLDDQPKPLILDGYFPRHDLIVEYWERQHYEAIPFFNKTPGRSEKRRLYDQRRADWAAENGKRFLVIPYHRLHHKKRRGLYRSREQDVQAIRTILVEAGLMSSFEDS